MRIAFRTDSSSTIGAGHFMRCFSLAEELQHQGHECFFVSGELLQPHIEKLANASIQHFTVSPSDNDTGLETAAILANQSAQALVVDHYQMGRPWEETAGKNMDSVLIIDDLCREHRPGSIILDPTLNRSSTAYENSKPVRALCGSDYALLAEQYYGLREARLLTSRRPKRSLLICFGGGQAAALTQRTIYSLSKDEIPRFDEVHVVLPGEGEAVAAVKTKCQELGFHFHPWVDDMSALLANTSHAIGAPGGMSWERCALGIPAILVQIADNQTDNIKALEKEGAIKACEIGQLEARLPELMTILDKDYDQMRHSALRIADGLGTRRAAQIFEPQNQKMGRRIFLRRAEQQDTKTVFDWQNEPDARKFSINADPPTWEVHSSWMNQQLKSVGAHFYIVESEGESAGFVRLNTEENGVYRISVLIAQSFQKRGIASKSLATISEMHREVAIAATVLPQNTASVALFENAGYVKQSETEYVLKAGR